MLNQETKWTSPSLTPCTKHHPTKITQETAAPGPGWASLPGSSDFTILRRPRQACSQFSLFRKSLSVLSFSPDLVFFPQPFVTWFSTVQKQLQFWPSAVQGFLGGQRSQWRHGLGGCPAPGFRPGLIWGLWGPRSTLLPNWKVNMDVGSNIITAIERLEGLWMDPRVVQHGMFSCTLKYSVLARPSHEQAAGRHDPGLHPVCSGALHFHSGDGMHSLRRGPETKRHACFAGGSLFPVCRDLWFNTDCVVHEGDHSKLSGLGSTKQQTWAWRSRLPWNHFGRAAGGLRHDLLHILSKEKSELCSTHASSPISTTQPEDSSAYSLKDYVWKTVMRHRF